VVARGQELHGGRGAPKPLPRWRARFTASPSALNLQMRLLPRRALRGSP
jgi:hypothetical protein